MGEYIFLFAQNGILFVLMFIFFISGLIMKVSVGIFYDVAIENALLLLTGQYSGMPREVIDKYKNIYLGEKECKNTRVFVDNSIHEWKKYGIFVERFDDMGNFTVGIGIFICVFSDMLMMVEKTFNRVNVIEYTRYIYIYSMIAIIIFIATKGIEIVVNADNKKIRLRDLITDYIDNHFDDIVEYVKINEKELLTDEQEVGINIKNSEIDENSVNDVKDEKSTNDENSENNVNIENNIKEIDNETYIGTDTEDDELGKEDKERVISQVLNEFLTE